MGTHLGPRNKDQGNGSAGSGNLIERRRIDEEANNQMPYGVLKERACP